MKVAPFSNNVYKSQNNSNTGLGFGHGHSAKNSSYSPKEKALISATTAIGVMASLAMLAKNAKYSLKPSKMFSNIKKSYLASPDWHKF